MNRSDDLGPQAAPQMGLWLRSRREAGR